MKRFLALILVCFMSIPVFGCGGGGGEPTGEGKLLRDNPRAHHYDQEDTDVNAPQESSAETTQEQ